MLLPAAVTISFHYYKNFKNAKKIQSVTNSHPTLTSIEALQNQDQAFTQTILELVGKYYVHADAIPYGAWIQEALHGLQESQGGFTYSPGSSTLSFEGHSLLIAPVTTLEEISTAVHAIASFLNQTRFREEWKTAKDLSPGCVHLLEALLQALDPHSMLMSQDQYAELRQTTEGKFGGLGLLLHMEKNVLSISKVIAHSPAQRQGLVARDRIISIDGTPTYGKSLDEITSLLRGEAGTYVRLSVLTATDWGPREVRVHREIIHVPSVEIKDRSTPRGHFLQLKILSFSQHTTQEVVTALQEAEKKTKLDGLILDLRENPGGLLDEAIHMASLFLPKGIVVRMKGQTEEFQSVIPVKQKWNVPIVTIMNGNSASASEILAGALKDHLRSVVIGTRSYGKASVQTLFDLPYTYALKLTIARYFTPNGTSIQDKGIVPDIWLQPVAEKKENRDLLGEDRYRQEKFLVNETHTQKELQQEAPLVGYYIKHPRTEDRTLQMAMLLLEKHHPFATLHHSREIKAKLTSWSQEVATYLATRHHIRWEESPIPHSTVENVAPVTLSLSLANPILHPHKLASATYEVRNQGKLPLHGLSLLFSDPELLGAPVEALIGTLPPAGIFRGTLAFIPGETSTLPLSVQMAHGGTRLPSPLQTLPLDVRLYPPSSVKALAVFTADNPLSSLQANGSGTLHVRITNTGTSGIHHLVATIKNLGGKQIEVETRAKSLGVLAAGSTQELDFTVRGAQLIATPTIELGLAIEGDELPQSLLQSISVSATPVCKLSARR